MRTRTIGAIVAAAAAIASLLTGVPASAAPTFVDVSDDRSSPSYSEFAAEISWLAAEGISTGWEDGVGVRWFRPWQPITRDAMAAFLYRYAGSPPVDDAAAPPFSDVPAGSEFTSEITWLASTGISTGWEMGDGTREFRPWDPITRDAMAAFLFRYWGDAPIAGSGSRFVDVPPGTPFATEIDWLRSMGISAGYDLPSGLMEYRPWSFVTRDAMAAFLYRYANGGIPQFTGTPTPAITGNTAVGQTISAAPGTWTPAPSAIDYQWLRGGSPIAGAIGSSYSPQVADAGSTITVRVTARRDGYLSASRQSAPTTVSLRLGASISAGEAMPAGASLNSADGRFSFTVDPAGDLVLAHGQTPIWRSHTGGNAVAQLQLGSNGVLALVRTDGSLAWSSTPGTAASPRLVLRDDGALVVVSGSGAILWSALNQGSLVFGLPYEKGQRWQAGAAHGGANGAWNALDFGPSSASGASTRVVSIAAGTVRWNSCGSRGYLAVDHGGGWTSGYYHLVNEQTQLIGQRVDAGTYLGDVGRAVPCGGSANFDHVHLTISYKSQPVHMNGFMIGGYVAYSSGQLYHGYWNDTEGRHLLTAPGGARCCLTSQF